MSDTITAEIERLYAAAFNRTGDATGLAYWEEAAAGGFPISQVALSFTQSPEFIQDYGGLTPDQFVQALYQNVLGRPGDPGGEAYWDQALASGLSQGALLNAFAQSAENVQHTADVTAAAAAVVGTTGSTVPAAVPAATPNAAPAATGTTTDTTSSGSSQAASAPSSPVATDPSIYAMGTATAPFDPSDLIGATSAPYPSMTVSGFLSVGNVENFNTLTVNGGLTASGSVMNVATLAINGSAVVELASDPGAGTDIVLIGLSAASNGGFPVPGTSGDATLILNNAQAGQTLGSTLTSFTSGRIELPDLTFNGANLVTNLSFGTNATSPGAVANGGGTLDLTQNGNVVYAMRLSSWEIGEGVVTTGTDAATGHPYVQIG
jgi:hypothetical protein